jgi:ectoine hydroxylase-related dioxygenase (phytanoyl-CoA dioxygenase family)
MPTAIAPAPAERLATLTPADDLELLKHRLEVYGYALIPELIPRADAARMSARLIELMRRDPTHAERPYQNLHGVFNALETDDDLALFTRLVDHPVALALAEHQLGRQFQMSVSGALWLKPHAGSAGFGWHADVPMGWFAANRKPRVDLCFAINCLWMLTDFTTANGATRIMPFSHRSHHEPQRLKDADFSAAVTAEAPAGSCLVFDNALWHSAGANTSDEDRVGLSNPYFPSWLDGCNVGWTPIERRIWERLPPHVQRLHTRTLDPGIAGATPGMTRQAY